MSVSVREREEPDRSTQMYMSATTQMIDKPMEYIRRTRNYGGNTYKMTKIGKNKSIKRKNKRSKNKNKRKSKIRKSKINKRKKVKNINII